DDHSCSARTLFHRDPPRHLFERPGHRVLLEGSALHPGVRVCHAGAGGTPLSEEAGLMRRIGQIVRKEFIQIRRDQRLMRMVLIAPMLQLLIYGYVVATEIRALPMAVLDRAPSAESRRLVDRFVASGYFT